MVMIFWQLYCFGIRSTLFFNFQVKEVISKAVGKAIVAQNGTKSNSSTYDSSSSRRGTSSSTNGRSDTSSISSSPNNGSKSSSTWKKRTRWNDSSVLSFGWERKVLRTTNEKIENYLVDFRLNKTTIKLAWQPDQKIKFLLDSLGAGWMLRPGLCFRRFYASAPERSKNTSRVVWIVGLRCDLHCGWHATHAANLSVGGSELIPLLNVKKQIWCKKVGHSSRQQSFPFFPLWSLSCSRLQLCSIFFRWAIARVLKK